ncbi:MAG: hypothetical protein P9M14_06625 [Candidatus Alcyoniella australis]|nr:hypothetical protein [Candidatus Alcyoniella australis]
MLLLTPAAVACDQADDDDDDLPDDGGLQILYAQYREQNSYDDGNLYHIAKPAGGDWGEPEWIGHGSGPSALLDHEQQLQAVYFINPEHGCKKGPVKYPDLDPIGLPGELIHLSGSPGDWHGAVIERLEDNESPSKYGIYEPQYYSNISLGIDQAGAQHDHHCSKLSPASRHGST